MTGRLPRCALTLADHIGFDGGFINKDNAFRLGGYGWNTIFGPCFALMPYRGAALLGHNQRFLVRKTELAQEPGKRICPCTGPI